MEIGKFVVVTTNKDQRGVFGGYLAKQDGDKVTLTQAQNCIYWSAKTRGVFGLAVTGPAEGSKIGPPVPEIELVGVTSVSRATVEAEQRWKDLA